MKVYEITVKEIRKAKNIFWKHTSFTHSKEMPKRHLSVQ